MQITLNARHLKKNKLIQDFFDERISKLRHHLSHFEDDTIFIHGNLEKNPHKDKFYVSLSVHIPLTTLHARGYELDLFKAINTAFDSIIRQAEKIKAKRLSSHRRTKNKEEVLEEDKIL